MKNLHGIDNMPQFQCSKGCAGSFALKRKEAKLKRNLFRFEAKQRASSALKQNGKKKRKKTKHN